VAKPEQTEGEELPCDYLEPSSCFESINQMLSVGEGLGISLMGETPIEI